MLGLTTFPSIVVVLVALAAAATDVHSFRVPNLLTVPLLLLGVVYHSVTGGIDGFQASMLGGLSGFAIMLILYVPGAVGAGDVKLVAGVGAWLGVWILIYVFAVAAAATLVYSLVLLVRQRRLGACITQIQVVLMQMLAIGKHLKHGEDERVELLVQREDRRKRLVPFAAMIALGVIVVLVWSQFGDMFRI